ncbi:hypothetical protein BKA69DRAFT_1049698 [Paraphysoderma sedebokerense]|nr:hypothetical protein BKA69DRAFT_1049698 [Paraphysoderma sedebokerense]
MTNLEELERLNFILQEEAKDLKLQLANRSNEVQGLQTKLSNTEGSIDSHSSYLPSFTFGI